MSTIFDNIKKSHLNARKTKDVFLRDTLGVIIGDLQTAEKNGFVIDDKKVVSILKKSKSDAESNFERVNDDKFNKEIEIYDKFIPKQMSSEEIKKVIKENNFSNIGQAMGFFKQNFSGQYDGKLVSSIVKESL